MRTGESSSRGSGAPGRAQTRAVGSKRQRASACSRCGALHSVWLRKRPGRSIPYRTLPALLLPEDVVIPSCSRCKAEFLDKPARESLAPLLAKLYAAELQRRIQNAIAALVPTVSQRRLEHLLGLSAGYLSRLKAGAGIPSPALVLLLQQIALDPISRLREVERLWGELISAEHPDGSATHAGELRTTPRRGMPPFV